MKKTVGSLLILVGVMLGVIFTSTFLNNATNNFDFIREAESLNQCLNSFDDLEDAAHATAFSNLQYCNEKIVKQSLLEEFQLRRIVFQTQYISDIVLLWVVVFITMSGVVLSGVQLLAAFKLSEKLGTGAAVAESSFEAESGKLAFRSSVTGLFILVFSFAFFYVYVIFVYEIEDPSAETGRNNLEFFNGYHSQPGALDALEYYKQPGTISGQEVPQTSSED